MDSGRLTTLTTSGERRQLMSDNRVITLPESPSYEDARRNECMHRVYSFLLELAARREAADRRRVCEANNLSADEHVLPEEQGVKGV